MIGLVKDVIDKMNFHYTFASAENIIPLLLVYSLLQVQSLNTLLNTVTTSKL